MNKMKVFAVNLDGTHKLLVAARNQKEAAKLFKTSVGSLRAYGSETGNKHDCETALIEPGLVWKARDDYRSPWERT
jgi:hypothetical protein